MFTAVFGPKSVSGTQVGPCGSVVRKLDVLQTPPLDPGNAPTAVRVTVPQGARYTVYVYGIPGGRYGDLSLAKVPAAQLTDAAAYRYWNGTAWVAGEAAATPVVKGPVGELSVRWSSYYKRWIMMYLVDDTGEIVLRTAPAPTGPWGPAQTGMALLPVPVTIAVVSLAWSGRLIGRFGPRAVLLTGEVLLVAGLLLLTRDPVGSYVIDVKHAVDNVGAAPVA